MNKCADYLLAATTYFAILPAYILARTNENKVILGIVQATLGIGGVIGSAFVSIYGVPRSKILTIILCGIGTFLLGDLLIGIGQSLTIWVIGALLSAIFIPFIMAAENSLWQKKIPPEFQGRIFSIKGMFSLAMMPLGFLIGGYLADYFFEPIFMKETILTFLVGKNSGAGMGMMFDLSGVLETTICLLSYLVKSLRNIEEN